MRDLVAALGLALAIEGLLFASFPDGVQRALRDAAEAPRDRMRIVGVISAAIGIAAIWTARQFLS